MGRRMDRTVEPRKHDTARAIFASGMVDITSEAILHSQRQGVLSESISRLMSTLHLSGPQQEGRFAIVGPPERISAGDYQRAKWLNTDRRVEVFSDRMGSNEEIEERASITDLGRLNTLVCTGRINRILLATPP